MRLTLGILASALLLSAAPVAAGAATTDEGARAMPSWKHVDIKTKQGFRGLAAVDATTAWVGGSDGGVWRTTDAGKTWDKVGPELAKPLLFRDVEATDADHAQILSIGPGRQSRDLPHRRRRRSPGSAPSPTRTRTRSTTAWRCTPTASTGSR